MVIGPSTTDPHKTSPPHMKMDPLFPSERGKSNITSKPILEQATSKRCQDSRRGEEGVTNDVQLCHVLDKKRHLRLVDRNRSLVKHRRVYGIQKD
jgi:hypothetical protein